METDITAMSIVELESLAYRQIALLEQTKVNLQLIQQEIAKKQEATNGTDKK